MAISRHLTADCGIFIALMPESNLSQVILRLQSGVAELSRRQQAAFFVCCAESLSSLYTSASDAGDKNTQLLHRATCIAWSFAKGGAPLSDPSGLLSELEWAMPNERVEAPQSTFAQDVVICLDAAIRAATTNEIVDPGWVQYVLEPITMMVCEEETGFYGLGSGTSADEWDSKALNNPRLLRAVDSCTKMLDYIKRREVFEASDVQYLVELSRDLA